MADISTLLSVPIANVSSFLGHTLGSADSIFGALVPSGGGGGTTLVYDETWMSVTAGTYTDDPITGSDETWDIASCTAGGVIAPNPATGLVTLSGNGDDWYLKNTNIGIVSGTYEYLYFEIQAPATNGSYVYFFLYNANADERVFQINFNDEDEIYINGAGPYDSGAGPNVTIPFKIIINHAAKTFDYDINGGTVTGTGVAWGDSTGTDGNMCRFEIYVGNNANNLKKLGRVYVGDGWA